MDSYSYGTSYVMQNIKPFMPKWHRRKLIMLLSYEMVFWKTMTLDVTKALNSKMIKDLINE